MISQNSKNQETVGKPVHQAMKETAVNVPPQPTPTQTAPFFQPASRSVPEPGRERERERERLPESLQASALTAARLISALASWEAPRTREKSYTRGKIDCGKPVCTHSTLQQVVQALRQVLMSSASSNPSVKSVLSVGVDMYIEAVRVKVAVFLAGKPSTNPVLAQD